MYSKKIFFTAAVAITAVASFVFAFASVSTRAHAAAPTRFYFQTPSSTVTKGSTISVQVLLDADRAVNAYDVTMHYSGPVTLSSVSNANSLITISEGTPDTSVNGEVTWRGGSAMAFQGMGGTIVTLNFVAQATGTASLSFVNSAVYLANGKGTKVIPEQAPYSITIAAGTTATTAASSTPLAVASGPSLDTTSPVISDLSIIQNPFDTKQTLLSFSASDSESGVKTTEARHRSWLLWSDWALVKNPTAIPQGTWEAQLRATDNAGNVALQTIYDWGSFGRTAGIAFAVLLIITMVLMLILRRRNRL